MYIQFWYDCKCSQYYLFWKTFYMKNDAIRLKMAKIFRHFFLFFRATLTNQLCCLNIGLPLFIFRMSPVTYVVRDKTMLPRIKKVINMTFDKYGIFRRKIRVKVDKYTHLVNRIDTAIVNSAFCIPVRTEQTCPH